MRKSDEIPPEVSKALEVVKDWLGLDVIQERTFDTLIREIQATSGFVEEMSVSISGRFMNLVNSAGKQAETLNEIVSTANTVVINDERQQLNTVTADLENTLMDIVGKIMTMSQQAITLVYELDQVLQAVEEVEFSIADIGRINSQTNLLALNATIEAQKAGPAGKTFSVVANEVRDLSHEVNSIAQNIRVQMEKVVSGVRKGHEILKDLATMDMTENLEIRDRLDLLVQALLSQNSELESVLNRQAEISGSISADITDIVTGMQFQDRTSQRLEQVVDTLQVLKNLNAEMASRTRKVFPTAQENDQVDEALLHKIAERYKLNEMREKFIARVLRGEEIGNIEVEFDQDSGGDIELF